MFCGKFCNIIRVAWWGALGAAVLLAAVGFGAEPSANPDRDVPGSVDLRPAFENWALELGSQGGRGTCSVFAVTGALEYALAGLQGRGTRLSAEFLNWASNQTTGEAADGGYFSDLWKGYNAFGICTEADCPYEAVFDPRWGLECMWGWAICLANGGSRGD